MIDYLIVGAGLYGAVFAHESRKRGKSVLVVDRRPHIAGNAYTEEHNGINVHKYGAHIFHTNDRSVWEYVNRFAVFNSYKHSPIANCRGELYCLPFNMWTFNQMWGVMTPIEAKKKIEAQRKAANITDPQNLEEQAICLFGTDIYEKLIRGYTEKQWGRSCKELPIAFIKRIPLRFCFDNNYFNALYQGIPMEGYTRMVMRMLDGVDVLLNYDYLEHKKELDSIAEKVVYTGAIDAYFNYKAGVLEYRRVRFETETLNMQNFQGTSVVNYTDNETPWTRIIEHKWFTFGKDREENTIPWTVISREYSEEWRIGEEPYYPVNNEKNNLMYKVYRDLAASEPRVIFGGRLGEYRYYDMDGVIAAAIERVKQEFSKKP